MALTAMTSSLAPCWPDDACGWQVCLPHLTVVSSSPGTCLIFLSVPRGLHVAWHSVVTSAESLETDIRGQDGKVLHAHCLTATRPEPLYRT